MVRSLPRLSALILLSLGFTADISVSRHTLAQGGCEPTLRSRTAPALTDLVTYPQVPHVLGQGQRVCWNQTLLELPWFQWQDTNLASGATAPRIALVDWGISQLTGSAFPSSNNWQTQPLGPFPLGTQGNTQPLTLGVHLTPQYRYLDLAPLAQTLGATVQVEGDLLRLTVPPAQVLALDISPPRTPIAPPPAPGTPPPDITPPSPALDTLVIGLDRPTPWHWGTAASPSLALEATATAPLPQDPRLTVTPRGNQVVLEFPQATRRPQVTALTDPPRLQIDFRETVPAPANPGLGPDRAIAWGPGLTWHQETLTLGSDRFPLQYLALDLPRPDRPSPLVLRPVWVGQDRGDRGLVGISPLLQLAQQTGVLAAINGTYFNRNTQMPLGAIRADGQWISGPILNRGVMAWDDTGSVAFGHALLTETVTLNPAGVSFPVLHLNSGYVKAGLSRYTAAWGATYTPLTDNETAVAVVGDRVQQIQRLGVAQGQSFPIPAQGYLLVARSYQTAANQFALQQTVTLRQALTPPDLSGYPHMLGAGPLLLQGGRSVLDGAAEQFSAAFLTQKAYRSAVGTTASGQLLWVTVQPQPGGSGATLAQLVTLLQSLGVTDALNLDGGSSTSLYLGGQLVNRNPRTAARVHNGLGLFLVPAPSPIADP